MKMYGGVDALIQVYLTSTLVRGEWSASRPGHFTSEERAPSIYWIGGWVGPRASLDAAEKRKFLTLPGLELRPLGRPARSQSLYRLRYPDSLAYTYLPSAFFVILHTSSTLAFMVCRYKSTNEN
jgi:hypothetical protein